MTASPKRLALVALIAITAAGCGALFNSGPALVTFTSSPEGADVYVNGTRRGVTPLSIPLPKDGDYVVTFRKDGYEEVVATVNKKVGAGWVIRMCWAVWSRSSCCRDGELVRPFHPFGARLARVGERRRRARGRPSSWMRSGEVLMSRILGCRRSCARRRRELIAGKLPTSACPAGVEPVAFRYGRPGGPRRKPGAGRRWPPRRCRASRPGMTGPSSLLPVERVTETRRVSPRSSGPSSLAPGDEAVPLHFFIRTAGSGVVLPAGSPS